jgi:farnesyl diphosphate synthase
MPAEREGGAVKAEGDFRTWMGGIQARVETALDRLLPAADIVPTRLHEAIRYAVLGGGKRVRPLLAFAAGEAVGAEAGRLERVACAVECIHAYSLVHDDLPCMDDDVLRRGKPTVHVAFGEATALLAGDSLQALAFQLLSDTHLAERAEDQLGMLMLFAQACGSRGMAGGQAIDLDSVGKRIGLAELEHMHVHKTGALIRAAVMLGAHCGGTSSPARHAQLEALDRYARAIGLAFQVVDDILDGEASTASLGKTAGKDAAQDKPTYISLMGSHKAKEFARELRGRAVDALASLEGRGARLAELADFIVFREF